jgi:hypothetical protein
MRALAGPGNDSSVELKLDACAVVTDCLREEIRPLKLTRRANRIWIKFWVIRCNRELVRPESASYTSTGSFAILTLPLL